MAKTKKDEFVPDYKSAASRLELLIRIPYAIIVYIFIYLIAFLTLIWGIWAGLNLTVTWFGILIFGKRWGFGFRQVNSFYEFIYLRFQKNYLLGRVMPYFLLLTDERPGFEI